MKNADFNWTTQNVCKMNAKIMLIFLIQAAQNMHSYLASGLCCPVKIYILH